MGTVTETIKFTTSGTSALSSASKQLKDMEQGLVAITAAFGAMTVAGGAAISKAIAASDTQINAEKRVTLALQQTKQATEEMQQAVIKQAGEMQKMAGIADERLLPLYARLNNATGDMNKTMALMPGIIDTAATAGKSVETVIQSMIMAYNGSTSSLRRYSVEVEGSSDKTKLFNDLIKEMSKFQGSAAIEMEKLSGWIKAIKLVIDDTFEPIGQKLDEWFRPLGKYIYEISKSVEAFVKENSSLVAGLLIVGTALAGLVTAIGAALLAASAFVASWGSISVVLGTVATAIGAVVTILGMSVGPITASVGLIGAAIAGLVVYWDEAKMAAELFFESIIWFAEPTADFLKYMWNSFSKVAVESFDYITDKMGSFGDVIKSVIDSIMSKINWMIDAVKSSFKFIADYIPLIGEETEKAVDKINQAKTVSATSGPASGGRPQTQEEITSAYMDNPNITPAQRINRMNMAPLYGYQEDSQSANIMNQTGRYTTDAGRVIDTQQTGPNIYDLGEIYGNQNLIKYNTFKRQFPNSDISVQSARSSGELDFLIDTKKNISFNFAGATYQTEGGGI